MNTLTAVLISAHFESSAQQLTYKMNTIISTQLLRNFAL